MKTALSNLRQGVDDINAEFAVQLPTQSWIARRTAGSAIVRKAQFAATTHGRGKREIKRLDQQSNYYSMHL